MVFTFAHELIKFQGQNSLMAANYHVVVMRYLNSGHEQVYELLYLILTLNLIKLGIRTMNAELCHFRPPMLQTTKFIKKINK